MNEDAVLASTEPDTPMSWKAHVKRMLFPGTLEDRRRYMLLRYLPPVVILLWLLIPLYSMNDETCNQNHLNENFYVFLFTYFFIYLIPAIAISWLSYFLFVGLLPSLIIVLLFSIITSFISIGGMLMAHRFYDNPRWAVATPATVLIAAAPVLTFLFLYAWKHDVARKRTEKVISMECEFDEGHGAAIPRDTDPNGLWEWMNVEKHHTAKEFTVYTEASNRIASKHYGELESMASGQTPKNSTYLVRVTLLSVTLILFLLTYLFCATFASFYYRFTAAEGASVFRQFSNVIFTVVMEIVKAISVAIAGKLDLAMDSTNQDKTARLYFGYIMDLFYFFFYRSLFMSVNRYEIVIALYVLSLFINLISFPIKMSRSFFTVLFGIINTVTFNNTKVDKNNEQQVKEARLKYEDEYYHYKIELGLEVFTRVIAQFISLICYTLCFAFLFYGYNKKYYIFPASIKTHNDAYGISNAAVFITYFPISLAFDTIYLIAVRKYWSYQTGLDAFKTGNEYLKDNVIFAALFAVTLHIGQDVWLARHEFNFCE